MNRSCPCRPVGEEARKAVQSRARNGFNEKYLSGSAILDIGYKGYLPDVVPIVPGAIGVELDYPGYDGVTLPFPDQSQDAVFASHCLEHIADFQNAVRDWFRVLKVGGYLIIMVPHKYLYEKQADLPSRYNNDHKRFYTPSSLVAEIEMSLRPNTYRLRHLADNDEGFDYELPPDRHSGGSYEIEIVVEKITPPLWDLARPAVHEIYGDKRALSPSDTAGHPPSTAPHHAGTPQAGIVPPSGHPVRTYDFGTALSPNLRILVLKLDHLGDFIIGLPSLKRLREAFPAAHIRLVVGSWNRMAAEAAGLVDDVMTYDYFPQNAFQWDGKPVEPLSKFRAMTAGRYDLAIDLRVDDDTRPLLAGVDAAMRCGIGSKARHPFLDVALPPEHDNRHSAGTLDLRHHYIGVDQFESRMPGKSVFHHETDFRPAKVHMIYGPHITLPLGTFTVAFALELTGWTLGLKNASVTLDVARNGETVALRRLNTKALKSLPLDGIELSFANDDTTSRYEFRVFVEGRSARALLRFAGVRLNHVEAPVVPRLRRAELHIGEQLSLLVQLAADRTKPLHYGTSPPQLAAHDRPATRRIIIAPLSNSDLRDWPAEHYVALVKLLLTNLDCTVTLIGAPQQAAQLDEIVHRVGDDARLSNLAGRTAWSDIPALLRDADLVICNNSGIAHLAAASGAQTLAIYSASHQPQEWGPRGQGAHALMAVVPCSPCGHDRLADCPNEHTCMRGLTPQSVFNEVCALLPRERVPAAPRAEPAGEAT